MLTSGMASQFYILNTIRLKTQYFTFAGAMCCDHVPSMRIWNLNVRQARPFDQPAEGPRQIFLVWLYWFHACLVFRPLQYFEHQVQNKRPTPNVNPPLLGYELGRLIRLCAWVAPCATTWLQPRQRDSGGQSTRVGARSLPRSRASAGC